MINFYIDKIFYKVPSNLTILQACNFVGISIPHFCYNNSLNISGNCRMCLVEVSNSGKPVVSCSTLVYNNMEIFLTSPVVQKSRENIIEFLLLNHPLDCPICDQGGECDLQDQSLFFGSDRSRFFFNKKCTSDLNISSAITSIMTRCIHCSRCVRFSNKIVNSSFLGFIGRGSNLEVGSFIKTHFLSEFSGNIIDLCPVGAFTSKDFKFRGRSWELESIKSFNFFNIFETSININIKGKEILRILPIKTLELDFSWISDKDRFSFDSFKLQRIVSPLIKVKNQFIKKSWNQIFKDMGSVFKKGSILGVIGEQADLETIFYFKKLLNYSGSSNIILENSLIQNFNHDFQSSYILSNTIQEANFILIINLDLRFESPYFNLQIKNIVDQNADIKIYNIGQPLNLMYPVKQLGWHLNTFLQIMEGKHITSKIFKKPNNTLIFSGIPLTLNFSSNFLNFNFWDLNSLDVGLDFILDRNSLLKNSNLFILLNSNIINLKKYKKKNVIFIGFQGGFNTTRSTIILPGTPIIEKCGKFISIFGNRLPFRRLFHRFKLSRPDCKILSSLNIYFNRAVLSDKFFNKEVPLISKNLSKFSYLVLVRKTFMYVNNLELKIKNYFFSSNFDRVSQRIRLNFKDSYVQRRSYMSLDKNN